MEPKGFHRKLTAILSADVAGYSRLMQDDEGETVTTLESYKQAFFELIKQHRGRVVDSPGDNLLAEFGSVVDAVQCSVAAQKDFDLRNAQLSENRRMLFRIGVNLGDVIEEGDRIYGDGVNIAARLEALAQPGGICISKTAFDHIESKLPYGYEFLGEQTVKNIAKPVGAYRVILDPRVTNAKNARSKDRRSWTTTIGLAVVLVLIAGAATWYYFRLQDAPTVEKADPKQIAMPLPEMPSIAVLPFVNQSEDPKYQLLGDGITDIIINTLSKVPGLFVIARNSTFTYKGKPVTIKKVSEDLGVRYVLEGSIQASGDRIRITVQLIDALTGGPIWAERYEGAPTDLFNFQDDITTKALRAIQRKLAGGVSFSQAKFFSGTKGLECYLKFLETLALIQKYDIPNTKKALQVLEESNEMCQGIPSLYRLLAIINMNEAQFGISKSPNESLEKAKELLQKASSIDDSDPDGPGLLAMVYVRQREYDKAISEAQKGVTLDPGAAWTNYRYAQVLNNAGRIKEAIPLLEKAIRLNPSGPALFYLDYGLALRDSGQVEDSIIQFKKAVERAPNFLFPHLALAAAYVMSGREQEAHVEVGEVLRINPNYSVERYVKNSLYKDQKRIETIAQAYRKAGLPEKSASDKSRQDSSAN